MNLPSSPAFAVPHHDTAKCRALLVEDSFVLLAALKMLLEDHGVNIVGTASTLEDALTLVESADYDIAILDVNLHDKTVFPVADWLMERHIPFFFATAYVGLPRRYADIPVAEKPYEFGVLIDLVTLTFAQAKAQPVHW